MTLSAVDIPALAVVGIVMLAVGVVASGLVASALRADLSLLQARRIGLGAAVGVAVWLAFIAVLAWRGVFLQFDAVPPRLPMVPLAVLTTMMVLTRRRVFGRLLAVAPRTWPIALQVFRVGVELVLYALFVQGRVPVQMTFEGRNLDIVVGLTAPIVAFGVSRRRIGRGVVVVWNLLSLGILANIVVTAISSLPGPLHVAWGGVAPTVIAEPPFVWIPAFLVPLAVFGHIASLRQMRAAARASGAAAAAQSIAQPTE